MKKKTLVILITIMCILTSCDNKEIEEYTMNIRQYSEYKHLPDNPKSLIVEFDTSYVGTFEIEEEKQVDEIVSMIMKATITCRKYEPSGGGNIKITFVTEESTNITVTIGKIVDRNKEYVINIDDNIISILKQIGLEKEAINAR